MYYLQNVLRFLLAGIGQVLLDFCGFFGGFFSCTIFSFQILNCELHCPGHVQSLQPPADQDTPPVVTVYPEFQYTV